MNLISFHDLFTNDIQLVNGFKGLLLSIQHLAHKVVVDEQLYFGPLQVFGLALYKEFFLSLFDLFQVHLYLIYEL